MPELYHDILFLFHTVLILFLMGSLFFAIAFSWIATYFLFYLLVIICRCCIFYLFNKFSSTHLPWRSELLPVWQEAPFSLSGLRGSSIAGVFSSAMCIHKAVSQPCSSSLHAAVIIILLKDGYFQINVEYREGSEHCPPLIEGIPVFMLPNPLPATPITGTPKRN